VKQHDRQEGGDIAEWTAAMGKLGALPIELYRLAFGTPVQRFQELALDAARRVLRFDSARWVLGMREADGPVFHASYRYRQAPESGAFRECDPLLLEALHRPGEIVDSPSTGAGHIDGRVHDAIARGHPCGCEPIPGSGPAAPALNLIEGIAFYRTDYSRRFSKPERLLAANLVPQLADTWRINRLLAVQGDRRSMPQPNETLAICDGKRLLHAAGHHFATMVQTEWKQWQGPYVPAELLAAKTFLGGRIVVVATPINDMWLLTIRRRSRTDRLTARERDIARRFGHGLDYREVARELRISPATARNHLKNIYGKLEINSKVELASLMRQIDRGPAEVRSPRSVDRSG